MASLNPQIRLRESALEVLKVLETKGFKARFAGGCVRDNILGLTPKDYDIATTAMPNDVMAVFGESKKGRSKYKAIPTGIDHGTITVVSKDGPVEITTLRRDVDTDGRHALVEFGGASFEDDAARRDFTINAMFEDRHGVIYDFHNGREHIKRGVIAFVGDAETRIKEDYLRILRFFRFWARFAFEPEAGSMEVLAQNVGGLESLSQERITSEIWGILQADKPQHVIEQMKNVGILAKILPEVIHEDTIIDNLNSLVSVDKHWRPVLRLAFLLADSGTKVMAVEPIGIRLRLPQEQINRIKSFLDALDSLGRIEKTATQAMTFVDLLEKSEKPQVFTNIYKVAMELWLTKHTNSQKLENLRYIAKVEDLKGYLRRTKLPLNGNDVMNHLSIQPNEKLGEILLALKQSFRSEEWKTRTEGFAWLDKYWI